MVTEHENTIEKMREHYETELRHYFFIEAIGDHVEHNASVILDTPLLADCTLLQLQSLWTNFASKRSPIKLHHCNPADHLSLTAFGMYIGIEPDGYTHS